jgi:aminoglycoside phosphotransferase family enzyme
VEEFAINGPGPTLGAKVGFLSRPEAYRSISGAVIRRETHMSWVFLAGDWVYKLKKPVRFPYLDYSTLGRREAACREELRLNRKLAPDIYLDVLPLVDTGAGLSIGGVGTPVDWLVLMRRLDERNMLDQMIAERCVKRAQLDRFVATLAEFYRSAKPAFLSSAVYLADWHRSLAYNRRVLLDSRLGLPAGLVRRIDRAQRLFLEQRGDLIADRIRHRRIVEGHGDLRPEHISLADKVRIIDCLEFNQRLRVVDPFDEVAFLSLECERLGAPWAGAYIERRMKLMLRDGPVEELFTFYRCHRATLRGRLAIAHLLEEHPRTPEKWPRVATAYLKLAETNARRLEALLRKPRGRSGCVPHASGELFPRVAVRPARRRAFCCRPDVRAERGAPRR